MAITLVQAPHGIRTHRRMAIQPTKMGQAQTATDGVKPFRIMVRLVQRILALTQKAITIVRRVRSLVVIDLDTFNYL